MFNRPKKLTQSLTRTREGFFGKITSLLTGQGEVNEGFWEHLEELLIQADVGVETTVELVDRLRQWAAKERIREAGRVEAALKDELVKILAPKSVAVAPAPKTGTFVILVVGVNGTGKTTSIAKLAHYYHEKGEKVVLAAADTFRAAAIEQLQIWGKRAGAEVIAHQSGADPAAVAFDAMQAATARGAGVLVVDTAGRLHTKHNLMEELKKVRRVINKQMPEAPHQVLLVIDATTGQNAVSQARVFTEAVTVSGIVLSKLDGTAKGGAAFAIASELALPILFVGTGEKMEDWAEFDAREFVEGLFGNGPGRA
jgi:fused signal recognition particle receptor